MKFYPLKSALADLYDMHGLSLNEDEFETYAFKALEYIGNWYGETVTEQFLVKDHLVTLPDECYDIEQVTKMTEDFKSTDSIYRENYANQIIEDYIEQRKGERTPALYQKGGFIDFEQINANTIRVKEDGIYVYIMYRKRLVDEDGLPMITHKELDAVSAFCLYVYNSKKLNLTKDKSTAELLPMYQQNWLKKCDNARTPDYLSQNDMDELGNAITRWDRKTYNISHKIVK